MKILLLSTNYVITATVKTENDDFLNLVFKIGKIAKKLGTLPRKQSANTELQ